MFISTTVKEIPFSLNIKPNTTCDMVYLFDGARQLEHLPVISNCKISTNGLQSMC
jgi:hypothetical protein